MYSIDRIILPCSQKRKPKINQSEINNVPPISSMCRIFFIIIITINYDPRNCVVREIVPPDGRFAYFNVPTPRKKKTFGPCLPAVKLSWLN